MKNLEDILQAAISDLRKGQALGQVLERVPQQHRQAISQMLNTATLLMSMPKNEAPIPTMRRKYNTLPVEKHAWHAVFHISRLASFGLSLATLLVVLGTTAYATVQSLPGQKLFGLKKSAEQLQLKLVSDPVEKATIYAALSEKRLKEAEAILSSSNPDIKLKIAVLNELSAQTNNAVAEIQKAASERPLGEQDKVIVDALDNLTKKQQTLLSQIQPAEETQNITTTAKENVKENETKITEFKKNISIANSGKEQALITLSPDPNSLQISGILNSVGKDKIVVEKITFIVSSSTVIETVEKDRLSLSDLTSNSKVNVIGIKDGEKILAQEILIVGTEKDLTEVKGASTSTPATHQKATSTATTVKKQTPTSTEETIEEPQANQATGTIIFEDPSPQFVP